MVYSDTQFLRDFEGDLTSDLDVKDENKLLKSISSTLSKYKGVYNDNGLHTLNNIKSNLKTVLDSMVHIRTDKIYPSGRGRTFPIGRSWIFAGGFLDSEDNKRVAIINVKCMGDEFKEEPLAQYTLSFTVEVLDPNKVKDSDIIDF